MARLLEEAHWLYERDVSSVLFPRSYNLSREPKAFLEDFRLTAAAGLLKWFVQRMQDCPDTVNLGHRTIPMSRLEFAIKRCEEFIACANHQNIDEDFVTELSEEEWNSFLDDYNVAVHDGAGIDRCFVREESRTLAGIRFPSLSFGSVKTSSEDLRTLRGHFTSGLVLTRAAFTSIGKFLQHFSRKYVSLI